jgi:hypothetical protein
VVTNFDRTQGKINIKLKTNTLRGIYMPRPNADILSEVHSAQHQGRLDRIINHRGEKYLTQTQVNFSQKIKKVLLVAALMLCRKIREVGHLILELSMSDFNIENIHPMAG